MNLNEVLHGTLRRMHHVRRYSSVPVLHPENVAEHSWQAAAIAWFIAKDLERNGVTIIVLDVLERAMFHDVSESLSGDIIRSFKHSSPELARMIMAADFENMHKLMDELDVKDDHGEDDLLGVWAGSKNRMLEGHIVKLADLLCVVSYCAEQSRMGNQEIERILYDMFPAVDAFRDHDYLGKYVREVYPTRQWRDPIYYKVTGFRDDR